MPPTGVLYPFPLFSAVIATAKELGVTVVAYSPIGRGFLTGTFTKENLSKIGDFRSFLPRFQEEVITPPNFLLFPSGFPKIWYPHIHLKPLLFFTLRLTRRIRNLSTRSQKYPRVLASRTPSSASHGSARSARTLSPSQDRVPLHARWKTSARLR